MLRIRGVTNRTNVCGVVILHDINVTISTSFNNLTLISYVYRYFKLLSLESGKLKTLDLIARKIYLKEACVRRDKSILINYLFL